MAGYGFAEKWDMEVYISDKHTKWNHIPEEESIQQILSIFPNVKLLDKDYNSSTIVSNFGDTKPTTDISIDNYFQDVKYFPKKYIHLNLPTPPKSIIEHINTEHLYFIHFRLGDYLSSPHLSFDLTKYYIECINRIKIIDSNATYIVISNEVDAAANRVNDNLPMLTKNNTIYDNNTSRIDSLYYMSKCKGGICANSTFSWMGAYCIEHKNKDLIFMPKQWVGEVYSEEMAEIYPDWATIVNISELSGGGYNKILISYSSKEYKNAKKSLKETALKEGNINTVIQYSYDDIDEEFKNENKEILDLPRGAGYWLWKPYFILKALNTMNENDVLIYCDTAMRFIASLDIYINKMKSSIMLFQHTTDYIEKQFTKGDIFKEFNCLNDKNITDTKQLDASHSIWKKDDKSIGFVTEWLNLCKNKQLLTDEKSIEDNLEGFHENRHDQSILSVLAKVKKEHYDIQIENSASDYGPRMENRNLPVLLNHHRSRN